MDPSPRGDSQAQLRTLDLYFVNRCFVNRWQAPHRPASRLELHPPYSHGAKTYSTAWNAVKNNAESRPPLRHWLSRCENARSKTRYVRQPAWPFNVCVRL